MTADSSHSLEALARQWRESQSPQVGLQLAEEHRKGGDLEGAIQVLEAGLEAHPDHMSTRVALSRYLVDGERFEEALVHLEQIVRIDPAHLVGNKLLVRTHIGLGRLDEARDKLDIYEMLGEGDADIPELRAAVEEEPDMGATEEAAAPEPESSGVEESPAESPGEPAPFGASPFEQSVEAQSVPAAGAADEPFGSVWKAEDSSDYWGTVRGEGIFSVTTDEVEAPEPAEDRVPAAAEASIDETQSPSSVTLGDLYREQGYPQQAAENYREVLEREPGNEAAREGLASVSGPAVEGVTAPERKMAVLIEYRDRLRRAVEAGG